MGVIATIKHFIANEQEAYRMDIVSNQSYLYPIDLRPGMSLWFRPPQKFSLPILTSRSATPWLDESSE